MAKAETGAASRPTVAAAGGAAQTAEARPRTPGEVWKSHDFQRCHDGYLVTERGNIDRPIAYVDASGLTEMNEDQALSLAMKIAVDPRVAGDPLGCMDLRHFGHLDSTLPMPGWIYGIWCKPVHGALFVPGPHRFVQPSPFCPIRRARLNQQFREMTRQSGKKKATAKRATPTRRQASKVRTRSTTAA